VELEGPQSANRPPVAPGDVVAEKYRIERVLGIGGMGFVMAARHITLDQAVAIKFLIPRHNGEAATERFEREARASARIESDHVCRVFDTGTLPTGMPFMVMEYLDGHDLEVELEGRSGLPVPQAVDYVLQALDAVAAAHSIGIIHRDLKPANLFLTVRADYSRRLKVLDFGISKMLSDSIITDTKGIIGTPAYMSPEQAKNSRKTDLRTDIWSMGAIMYELFSGQPPYVGETVGEVLALVLNESPKPLRELAPNLPPGTSASASRGTAKIATRALGSSRGPWLLLRAMPHSPRCPSPAPISQSTPPPRPCNTGVTLDLSLRAGMPRP
jgi:eukaryotic-like serine/threonine-protein kinase